MPKSMQQYILNAKVKVFFKAYFKTPLFVIPKSYFTFYLLFYKYGICSPYFCLTFFFDFPGTSWQPNFRHPYFTPLPRGTSFLKSFPVVNIVAALLAISAATIKLYYYFILFEFQLFKFGSMCALLLPSREKWKAAD